MNKILLSLFGIKMKGFECTIIMDTNKGDKDSFQGQSIRGHQDKKTCKIIEF